MSKCCAKQSLFCVKSCGEPREKSEDFDTQFIHTLSRSLVAYEKKRIKSSFSTTFPHRISIRFEQLKCSVCYLLRTYFSPLSPRPITTTTIYINKGEIKCA